MNSSLKIAVVGGGYWGKNLIRNFNKLEVIKGFFYEKFAKRLRIG